MQTIIEADVRAMEKLRKMRDQANARYIAAAASFAQTGSAGMAIEKNANKRVVAALDRAIGEVEQHKRFWEGEQSG